MIARTETMANFAKMIWRLLEKDHDVNIGTGGFTGVGKSTFAIQLLETYQQLSGKQWNFDQITWSREELMKWIDGDKEGKGQLPEYSGILADELISLFFKRNWWTDPQKDAIELFNKCRDRHLLIIGNIPNFWDLDSGLITRLRYYVYLPVRGMAWVFEQENNPFTHDVWNRQDNMKFFRKNKIPSTCSNFLFEINFQDLPDDKKAAYLHIRNTKRVATEGQHKQLERVHRVVAQRNDLMIYLKEKCNLSVAQIAVIPDIPISEDIIFDAIAKKNNVFEHHDGRGKERIS